MHEQVAPTNSRAPSCWAPLSMVWNTPQSGPCKTDPLPVRLLLSVYHLPHWPMTHHLALGFRPWSFCLVCLSCWLCMSHSDPVPHRASCTELGAISDPDWTFGKWVTLNQRLTSLEPVFPFWKIKKLDQIISDCKNCKAHLFVHISKPYSCALALLSPLVRVLADLLHYFCRHGVG